MLRFIIRRTTVAIPTLIAVSIFTFIIIQLPPGDYLTSYVTTLRATGETVDEAVVRPSVAVAATLGGGVSRDFESPGTRAKTAAMLREALVAAESYRERLASEVTPDRDLGL